MAQYMKNLRMLVLLLAVSTVSRGQSMSDPTRPPGGIDPNTGIASPSVSSGGGLVLQSVLISPQRRLAVIGGETVKLGSRIGGAVVVKIEEGQVTLREGQELKKLKLYAGFEKHVANDAASANSAKSSPTKQR